VWLCTLEARVHKVYCGNACQAPVRPKHGSTATRVTTSGSISPTPSRLWRYLWWNQRVVGPDPSRWCCTTSMGTRGTIGGLTIAFQATFR
jgi:hypothetical protein